MEFEVKPNFVYDVVIYVIRIIWYSRPFVHDRLAPFAALLPTSVTRITLVGRKRLRRSAACCNESLDSP